MKKILTYGFSIFALILVLALTAYTGYWHWYSGKIAHFLNNAIERLDKEGITFTQTPRIGGYPFPHHIIYKGDIQGADFNLKIPYLKISGISRPGNLFRLTLPQGAQLYPLSAAVRDAQQKDKEIEYYDVKTIDLRLGLPTQFPTSLNHEDIKNWQKTDPRLSLYTLDIQAPPLAIILQGIFTLDQNLQPQGEIIIRGDNFEDAVAALASDTGNVTSGELRFLQGILKSLSKTDEKTGKTYLHIALDIQDSTLKIGPLKLASIPHIHWPKVP